MTSMSYWFTIPPLTTATSSCRPSWMLTQTLFRFTHFKTLWPRYRRSSAQVRLDRAVNAVVRLMRGV